MKKAFLFLLILWSGISTASVLEEIAELEANKQTPAKIHEPVDSKLDRQPAVPSRPEVKPYSLPNGKEPYTEWFEKLRDKKAKAKIAVKIDRIKLGNFGGCEAVGEGLSELKIDYGPGYRVYFGQAGDAIIILLCGGDKSTQSKDIKKAYEYWKDLIGGDKQ